MEVIDELLLRRSLDNLTNVFEEIVVIRGKAYSGKFDISSVSVLRQRNIEKKLPRWIGQLKRNSKYRVTEVLLRAMLQSEKANLDIRFRGQTDLLETLISEGVALDLISFCASGAD